MEFPAHQVNPDMENFDVVLVMGANDVVNSAAQVGPGTTKTLYPAW